jgi:hypothetical protein
MNWQLGIALYAAVLSTMVLIWRLIEYYFEKAGRVKVVAFIRKMALLNKEHLQVSSYINIEIALTNFSKHNRLIEKPIIITDKTTDEQNKYSNLGFPKEIIFPLKLEPGEKHKLLVEKVHYYEELKRKGIKKIKISVTDTLNKTYKSKWILLK